jgi:hypothetical protein
LLGTPPAHPELVDRLVCGDHNIAFPGAYLCLSAATLALMIVR